MTVETLKARLAQMEQEYQKGETERLRAAQGLRNLEDTMQRIAGAMVALQDLIQQEQAASAAQEGALDGVVTTDSGTQDHPAQAPYGASAAAA